MAVILEKKKMMCVRISEIRSNFDDYKKRQGRPAMCMLFKEDNEACRYFFKDQQGQQKLINVEYCECSLME